MIYYVLLELGWEYNDEYYFRSENNDGRPKAVFTSRADAEKECINRTICKIECNDIEYYLDCYTGYREEERKENFKKRFPTINLTTRIETLPKDIQENIVNWLEELDICFYEIIACNS